MYTMFVVQTECSFAHNISIFLCKLGVFLAVCSEKLRSSNYKLYWIKYCKLQKFILLRNFYKETVQVDVCDLSYNVQQFIIIALAIGESYKRIAEFYCKNCVHNYF